MKKNTIMIFGAVIILLLPSTFAVAIDNSQQSGELKSTTFNNNDNIDRWAVIIGASGFKQGGWWCAPLDDARDLAKLLKKDNRWNNDNIKLLVNTWENPDYTKQGILNALDWLKDNSDDGDIVLFFYAGHGGHVTDINEDEKDGKDEIICPYDLVWDEETGEVIDNYITDDDLGIIFNEISNNNIKKMCLIFDCCFSGGLFENLVCSDMTSNGLELISGEDVLDMSNENLLESNSYSTGLAASSSEETLIMNEVTQTVDETGMDSNSISNEITTYEELFDIEDIFNKWNEAVNEANIFTNELTADINVDNSVLIASTRPDQEGIDFVNNNDEGWTYISFGRGICKALENGKTSAEDIEPYAKNWYYKQIFSHPLIIILQIIFNDLEIPRPILIDKYPAGNPSSAKLTIIGDE